MAENIPTNRARIQSDPRIVPEPPEPPEHLGPESREHWRAVGYGWVIGPDALPVLQAACEVWDRYQLARDEIARDGLTVTHPSSGALQTHPAWQVCRDSLREWRQLWRQLGLEPPDEAEGGFYVS